MLAWVTEPLRKPTSPWAEAGGRDGEGGRGRGRFGVEPGPCTEFLGLSRPCAPGARPADAPSGRASPEQTLLARWAAGLQGCGAGGLGSPRMGLKKKMKVAPMPGPLPGRHGRGSQVLGQCRGARSLRSPERLSWISFPRSKVWPISAPVRDQGPSPDLL